MTKANKISLMISVILSSIILLIGGAFLGVFVGSHLKDDGMEAEIGNEKLIDQEDSLTSTMAQTSTYADSNGGGTISTIRFYVFYDTSYFSSVSVTAEPYGPVAAQVFEHDITISMTLPTGATFNTSSFSGIHYYTSGIQDQSTTSSNYTGWSTENHTCTISNNSITDWVDTPYGGTMTVVLVLPNSIVTLPASTPPNGESPEFLQGQIHIKIYVRYDPAYFSTVTVNAPIFSPQNNGMVFFSGSVLTATLGTCCSWASSSYSTPFFYKYDANGFITPPSSYSSWSKTSSVTMNRSGDSWSDNGINLKQYINTAGYWSVVFPLPSSTVNLQNYWVEQPSFSSYEYGQTPPTPTGYAAVSQNRKVYYRNLDLDEFDDYLNATYGEDWLGYTVDGYGESSTPPTEVGRYRCDIYDGPYGSTSRMHAQFDFYVYAPTPSVATPQTYTGSSITATPTYNSTFVNYPSGNVGTNVGTYTATFTINSNSQTYWNHTVYVYEESGDEWEEYYDIPRTVLFSNGTTSYSVSWQIQKQQVVIPIVSGSYTYDGTSKSATIGPPVYVQSYAAYVNQSGTASATNAGTYTIYFNLKNTSTTQWSDGTTGQKSGTWTISRNACATKPTHSAGTSHTYTGSNIVHGVNNYNTTYMTRSGTYQATNVGTYTVTYTLKSNYAWTDGTTGNVTLTWTITQATNSWTSSPSISSWTYGSAPSTINVGTPKFGAGDYIWMAVNADIFEIYYIVDVCGYSSFSLASNKADLADYTISEYMSYPIIQLGDNNWGNLVGGYDAGGDDYQNWSYLPPGRYYFYSCIMTSSSNYTTDNIYYFTEFYVWAPAPTVTNNTPYTYNGSNQGPTISGSSSSYYTTSGTTTAKNAGNYYFYIQAQIGTDSYSGCRYPYYFQGHTMEDCLDDYGYDSLAEMYVSEGWGPNQYAIWIVDDLSISYSYRINPKDISGGTITIPQTDYTYDGNPHKPTVTVTVP